MRNIGNLIFAGFGQVKNLRVDNVASDPASPTVGQVWYNTTENVYRGFDGSAIITFATGGNTGVLQSELDATQAAAGLNVDGTLAPFAGTNYLNSATTLVAADLALDAAAKAAADAVVAEAGARAAADTTLTNNLASEVSARQAADTTLTNNLASEVSARAAADTTLQGNIDAEVSARQAADTTLQGNIDAEVSARQAAVSSEASTRATADTALQTAIDNEIAARQAADISLEAAISADIADVQAELDEVENSIGISADGTLGAGLAGTNYAPEASSIVAAIVSIDTQVKGNSDNIQTLQSQFAGVDAALQAELDRLEAATGVNVDGSFISFESTNYLDAVSSVRAGVVALDTAIKSTSDAVGSEASARQAADTTLQGNIDSEAAARVAAVSGLQSELDATQAAAGLNTDGSYTVNTLNFYLEGATSLKEADGKLDAAIRAVEDSIAALSGGELTTLTNNLAAEVTNRINADTALQTAIDNEIAARQAADTTLQGNISSEAAARVAADSALSTSLSAIQGELDVTQAAVGLATDGTVPAGTFADATFGGATNVISALLAINTALAAQVARLTNSHVVYDGSVSATLHTVTHNIGVKYCQVTVVDSNDKVVIPDEIIFVDANTLTVSFVSAITCKVIVTAPKA